MKILRGPVISPVNLPQYDACITKHPIFQLNFELGVLQVEQAGHSAQLVTEADQFHFLLHR